MKKRGWKARRVLEYINGKPGAWFHQEAIAHACGMTARNVQAILCKWVLSGHVERAKKGDLRLAADAIVGTAGHFLYRVRAAIDVDRAMVDSRARMHAKAGRTHTTLQLALDPAGTDKVRDLMQPAATAAIAAKMDMEVSAQIWRSVMMAALSLHKVMG